MVRAQGLAVIPEDVNHLPAGEEVQVLMVDWPERE
jgi:molybdopterin biosynthesis enzyme